MSTNLHDLFKQLLLPDDERTLFVCPDGHFEWRYGQIHAAIATSATQWASELGGKNRRIIIEASNDPAFLVAFASAILAGVAPIVINPTLPPDELVRIVQETGATDLACLDATRAQRAQASGDFMKVWDRTPNWLAEASKTTNGSFPNAAPAEPAYTIFSSGSTGRPKPVAISHANAASEAHAIQQAYRIPDAQSHLCVLPVYHASALYRSVLMPMQTGGRIVLARSFDANRFWQWIADYDIAFVQVVPTILSTLLASESQPADASFESLRYIGCASAPLPVDLLIRFEQTFGVPVGQGYGLTETTCGAFFNHPDDRDEAHIGSVGKPIPGISVSIVNDNGIQVEPGEPGEVVLEGPMVVGRYENDAEPERFEEGRLRTHDIGYLDDMGYLFLQGRAGDIIHRSGFKIAPTEVESKLMSDANISQAVVFSVPHPLLGEDMIAYVHNKSPDTFDEYAIRKRLLASLPRHKVPTRVFHRSKLADDTTLKIQRQAIRQEHLQRFGLAEDEKASLPAPRGPRRAFKTREQTYIRPIMKADVESKIYLDNLMDPGVQFYTHSGRFPQSEHQIETYWATVQLPDAMTFAVCDKKTDAHVGNLALRIDWVARIGEFGRMIFKEFQHNPVYSMDAMQMLMEYAFDGLRLHKLHGGGCNPTSLPSLYKLGFKLEGCLRKHHFLNGDWRDQFMVGLLRDEYLGVELPQDDTTGIEPLDPAEAMNAVRQVMESAFFIDAASITSATSPVDVRYWDSLGIVTLWSLLEERFSVTLTSSDLMAVRNAEDIVNLLCAKSSQTNFLTHRP